MRKFGSRLSIAAALGASLALAPVIGCGGGATGEGTEDDAGLAGDADVDGALDGALDGATDAADDATTGDDTGGDDAGGDDAGGADTSAETIEPVDGAACTAPITIPGCGVDSDCDGIPDTVEGRYEPAGPTDTDGDGTPDFLDDDSDGDGILDRLEWRAPGCEPTGDNDADGDGIPNFRDDDSDDNGLPDKDEVCPPAGVLTKLGMAACVAGTPYDFDGDGVPDYLDFDNDHDSAKADKSLGLADKIELADAYGKYVGLVDTDGDGIPDVYDVDSDGDFILDLEDGTTDDDGDKVQAFRDTDTDGDGVPDWCEARGKASPSAADVALPLLDTDGDGIPDFRDLDSDGDFLADGKEDVNGDCIVGASETDRRKADTDGDGHGDLAEVTLLGVAGAKDPKSDPLGAGKFYFVEPYSVDGSAKPSPTSTPLALSTTLNQGDVAFLVDTTFSMGGIESALATSIASKVIPGLAAKIPDLAMGVIGYDDALAKPWGDASGDQFIWFPNGVAGGSRMTTDSTLAATAANKLLGCGGAGLPCLSSGGSYPEGTIPALWWAITGDAFSFYSSTTGLTKTFPAATGIPADRFGGLHFRKDALPILIAASDANMHNGLTSNCLDGSGVALSPCLPIAYGSSSAKASSLGHSPSISELVSELASVGAKFIGVSVHGPGGTATGKSSNPDRVLDPAYYTASLDMLYLARGTGAKVPPSVLGGTTSNCKTSSPGAKVNPADPDGLCPLVFDIRYDGAGLGDTVVNAVVALLAAIKFDVHVQALPVISAGVDPVDAFLASVLPMPTGGTDPITKKVCVTFPASQTADRFKTPKATTGTDGAKETILDLNPGPLYCFAVAPKPNTTVPAKTSAQVFEATLRVLAEKPAPPAGPGGTFKLGADRQVLFIVPPVLN